MDQNIHIGLISFAWWNKIPFIQKKYREAMCDYEMHVRVQSADSARAVFIQYGGSKKENIYYYN